MADGAGAAASEAVRGAGAAGSPAGSDRFVAAGTSGDAELMAPLAWISASKAWSGAERALAAKAKTAAAAVACARPTTLNRMDR